MFIAFKETYFAGGIVYTLRKVQNSVVSFDRNCNWTQLKSNSFVDGKVRVYHSGAFTFPVGKVSLFSPITLHLYHLENYLELEYSNLPLFNSFQIEEGYDLPQAHLWSWNSGGQAIAILELMWSKEHYLNNFISGSFEKEKIFFGVLENEKWISKKPLLETLNTSNENRLDFFQSGHIPEMFDLQKTKGVTFLFKDEFYLLEKQISEVITPNNDGTNDTWKIKGYNFNDKSCIRVYNQEGDLVFIHYGIYTNDWTGSSKDKGKTLPQGSYYYLIDLDGILPSEKKGWVYIKLNDYKSKIELYLLLIHFFSSWARRTLFISIS